jgi:YgiT-type zinc finger domain-containing protein
MICLICRQAELVEGLASIPFERGEFRLLIENVPASICPNCGEAVLEEDVAIQLLSEAEDVLNEGLIEDVRSYGRSYTALGHTPALAGGARELRFLESGGRNL